jgi:hypothetical protein
MKKEKVSQDHESKLSIKKQSPSKDKSVKVELKVDEQDEEDDDDDEIGTNFKYQLTTSEV